MLLVMIATSTSGDIIQPIWKKVTDQQVVLWSRVLTALEGIATTYLGLVKPPDLLLFLSNMSWAVMRYTFFCILTIGTYWKSANKYGAVSATIASGLVFVILRLSLSWLPSGVAFPLGWVIVTVVFLIISALTKSIAGARVDIGIR